MLTSSGTSWALPRSECFLAEWRDSPGISRPRKTSLLIFGHSNLGQWVLSPSLARGTEWAPLLLRSKEEGKGNYLLSRQLSCCYPPPVSTATFSCTPGALVAVKCSNHEMKGVFLIEKRSSGNNKSWHLLRTDSVPGTVLSHSRA